MLSRHSHFKVNSETFRLGGRGMDTEIGMDWIHGYHLTRTSAPAHQDQAYYIIVSISASGKAGGLKRFDAEGSMESISGYDINRIFSYLVVGTMSINCLVILIEISMRKSVLVRI